MRNGKKKKIIYNPACLEKYFSPKDFDILQRTYNGETYASIGRSYGVCRQRIEQIVKEKNKIIERLA